MDKHFIIIGTDREERLLTRSMGEDNRPFLQRITSNSDADFRHSFENLTDPEGVRERTLNDVRSQLQAFQSPDIFTADQNLSGGNSGGNRERLLSMTPNRRLEEFTAFVQTQIPASVQNLYPGLFSPPLSGADIIDYTSHTPGSRIDTILTALKSLNGSKVTPSQNPAADALALDTAAAQNNSSTAPGSMDRYYEQWLDQNPTIGEVSATSPETLLHPKSGIPDRLRGDLQNLIDPSVQKTTLVSMYKLYRNRRTDENNILLQAKVDTLQLTGSVEMKKLEQQSRGLVENFRNADPRLQLAMAAAGAAAVWMIFKAKNPIGRWALAGGLGYFAYDRFVNGNENALNDMGNGVQKFASAGGNILKKLAFELGLPIPRNAQDRIELMAEFIAKNRLNIPGHEAISGMEALSNVKLGTIAAAFNPSKNPDNLSGELLIDSGQTQFVSLGGKKNDISGNLLHKSLMIQMGDRDEGEKIATIAYLKQNSSKVGTGMLHAMYELAAEETPNIATAERIEHAVHEYGSYDIMPYEMRKQYLDIALEGKTMAGEGKYKEMSFVDVIAMLQRRNQNRLVVKKDDPSVPRSNVAEGRTAEFALLSNVKTLPVTTTDASDVLDTGSLAEKDISEFLANCKASGILQNTNAETELRKKFDKIRTATPIPKLSDALHDIEQLKYAVLVQSTKQETALTKDDIILLMGPDTLNATGILNRITGFLGRYSISVPRGFSNVSTLDAVRSLITAPWFGTGPVKNGAEDFKVLTDRMTIYEKRMKELSDTSAIAKKMAAELPSTVSASFGGPEKLEEAVLALIPKNYEVRRKGAEKLLSQRMANALASAQRLTHEASGFGRFDDEVLGLTEIKQQNLAKEFDLLFSDIMGDPLSGVSGMWQNVENIDTFQKYDLVALEAFDYSTDAKRLEAVQYATDLSMIYLVQKMSGVDDPAVKEEIGKRILTIYKKINTEREKAMRAAVKDIPTSLPKNIDEENTQKIRNLRAVLIIDNQESFKNLGNIMQILGLTPATLFSFKDLDPKLFPDKYEMPKNELLQFLSESWEDVHPIDYWKNKFFEIKAAASSKWNSATSAASGVVPPTATTGVAAPAAAAGTSVPSAAAGSTVPTAPTGATAPSSTGTTAPSGGTGVAPTSSPAGVVPPGP